MENIHLVDREVDNRKIWKAKCCVHREIVELTEVYLHMGASVLRL